VEQACFQNKTDCFRGLVHAVLCVGLNSHTEKYDRRIILMSFAYMLSDIVFMNLPGSTTHGSITFTLHHLGVIVELVIIMVTPSLQRWCSVLGVIGEMTNIPQCIWSLIRDCYTVYTNLRFSVFILFATFFCLIRLIVAPMFLKIVAEDTGVKSLPLGLFYLISFTFVILSAQWLWHTSREEWNLYLSQ